MSSDQGFVSCYTLNEHDVTDQTIMLGVKTASRKKKYVTKNIVYNHANFILAHELSMLYNHINYIQMDLSTMICNHNNYILLYVCIKV